MSQAGVPFQHILWLIHLLSIHRLYFTWRLQNGQFFSEVSYIGWLCCDIFLIDLFHRIKEGVRPCYKDLHMSKRFLFSMWCGKRRNKSILDLVESCYRSFMHTLSFVVNIFLECFLSLFLPSACMPNQMNNIGDTCCRDYIIL